MIASKITKRGQTTLPRQIQNALHIQPGQTLLYEIRKDEVVLKAHPGPLGSFGALAADAKPDVGFDKVRKQARKEWADHAQREGGKT